MKKNRLQQQTLDRFFKPAGVSRTQPPPSLSQQEQQRTSESSTIKAASSAHSLRHEVINVDEEAMNAVLHSAAPPAAEQSANTASRALPPRDKVWLLGQQQVIFPWSSLNTRVGPDGATIHVWDRITHLLREPYQIASSEDFCSLLVALDQLVDGPGNAFEPLRRAVGKMSADEQMHLFSVVLPWMKEVVLRAPTLFQDRTVPLLVQGETRRLVFAHEEVVTLMCCCFFSLFPQRSEEKKSGPRGQKGRGGKRGAEAADVACQSSPEQLIRDSCGHLGGPRTMWISRKLPCCNFSSLFSCGAVGRDASLDSKIRGFIEYFFCCHRHDANPLSLAHHRCVELTRAAYKDFPAFEESTAPLAAVSMRRTGLIENDAGALQVDFANRFVGGGVLRSGCVQEEIRMTLAPEMVLSRLVCEELGEAEVLFISGAPNFCENTGYAEKFRFKNGCDPWATPAEGEHSRSASFLQAPTSTPPPLVRANAAHPRTAEPMLIHDVCVLAMDAYNFRVRGRPSDQYQLPYLRREVRKAYVGFHGVSDTYAVLSTVRSGAIASGHWGCGAFCGNKELKLLLQWCAASEAGGRALHYYTFDTPLADFDGMHESLLAAKWTVGQLMQALVQYGAYRSKVPDGEAMRPFQFVEQVCATDKQ